MLIADDDPVALAQTARHLMDEVYQAPGQPRLRIALHHGEVQLAPSATATCAPSVVGGDAILCAARVEPMVEPGPDLGHRGIPPAVPAAAVAVAHDAAAAAPVAASASTCARKARREPDLWVRLYRLEF